MAYYLTRNYICVKGQQLWFQYFHVLCFPLAAVNLTTSCKIEKKKSAKTVGRLRDTLLSAYLISLST